MHKSEASAPPIPLGRIALVIDYEQAVLNVARFVHTRGVYADTGCRLILVALLANIAASIAAILRTGRK